MRNIKEISIKNCTQYFFNDMINIKNCNSSLLKIDKTSYKNTDIYYMGYIEIKDVGDYKSIHSVNPQYFIVSEVDRYTQKEMGKST